MYKKVCIIGEGITSLIITKMLLELNLKVDLISESFFSSKKYDDRSLAISHTNFKYLEDLKILSESKNYTWKIKGINLFNAKDDQKVSKIFDFRSKKNYPLFIMVSYKDLVLNLKKKITKNSSLKVYSKKNARTLLKNLSACGKIYSNNYSLVINCNRSNIINNKFFFKKIEKNYFSISFTLLIKHKKIANNIASQFFMNQGPMAFLPISNRSTLVVWSVNKKYLSNTNKANYDLFKKQIKKNTKNNLKILSLSKINKFNLNFVIPRDYYYENILSFGEALHQIHPLSGQGLNMIIRDIQLLHYIFKKNIDLGMDLNTSLLKEFSDKTKSFNYLFAKSVDLTEKYFSINNKIFNKISNQYLKNINKNIILKNILINIADKGMNIKN